MMMMEAQNQDTSSDDLMLKAQKKENNRMIKAQKKENNGRIKAKKQEKKSIFVRPPPTPSPQPHPWPWLFVTHGRHASGHNFYSISENCFYVRSIPQLRNKMIKHLSHGWLILEDLSSKSKQLSLLNTVSLQVIQLPKRCFKILTCSVLLFPPTDPNCHAVFFTKTKDSSTVFFCKPGDEIFQQHHIGSASDAVLAATIFQGKIYCVTRIYELLALDLDDISRPQVTTMINKTSFITFELIVPSYGLHRRVAYLFEFFDELFLVLQAFKGCHTQSIDSFSILRIDFSENMSWVMVKGIGENCAIFLGAAGRGMCRLASPEHGVKGNTVYFMNYFDRCLYSYDLLQQSYLIYPPCPNVKRTKSEFCWIPMEYTSSYTS